jgi:hypothetical protein
MKPQHGRAELVDGLGRRRFGEHRREQRTHELVRRQIGEHQRLSQALRSDVSRKRAAPSGVCGRQYQRHWDGGVSVVELQGKRTPERESGHVRLVQAEPVNEPGQAVGVAGHAKGFQRIS